MASEADSDLDAKALKRTLEKRGALDGIKAKIRSELFHAINPSKNEKVLSKKTLSNRDLVMNAIIREYLLHCKFHYTVSVFTPESGQPEICLERSLLAREFGIEDDDRSRKVPLLFSLLRKTHPKGWAFFDSSDQVRLSTVPDRGSQSHRVDVTPAEAITPH